MALVVEDEEKLYNYKNIRELKLSDWPSHTSQWRKYKSELTRIFAAWDWTGSTLSKWAKIAMNPNGKEGSYQRLLNWLTNESQGAERFDAILGSMAMDPKNTTLKISPWYCDFLLYQDRCTTSTCRSSCDRCCSLLLNTCVWKSPKRTLHRHVSSSIANSLDMTPGRYAYALFKRRSIY